jgi:hypothetical protein
MTRQGCGLIVGLIVAVCTRTIMAQCNTIDAVTTASFKITGGQACTNYANLNWTFNESNGTMIVKWGTSTSYGTQKSVYSSNPINITGLTPSTKYYYAVDGVFEGKSYQYTRSSFSTSGGTQNHPPVFTSATSVACTTGTTKTYTVAATDADNDPVTYTAGGLPNWISFASPTLTLKPVMGCSNTTVTIVASDGKGGLDTLQLAVSVVSMTGIAERVTGEYTIERIKIGNTDFAVPVKHGETVAIELFALNGTALGGRYVFAINGGSGETGLPWNMSPGVYLARVSWQNGSMQQKVFIGR